MITDEEFCWLLKVVFWLCCCYHCYTDFREQVLYDEVNLILFLAGLMNSSFDYVLRYSVQGVVAVGVCLAILYIVSRGGLGLGDVKLGIALGTWLGWEKGLASILIAIWLGCLVGLVLMALGYKQRKDAIAFGPYMCIGGGVMLYFGDKILTWYGSLF